MNPGPDRTTGALDSPSGDIQQLRAERDAALSAAQSAMRDTTRLTRLLTVLSEPAPLESLLDRVLSTLSELFAADIVAILDPVDAGSLVARAAIGLPEDVLRLPFSEVEGDHVAAVMRDRVPLLVQDVAGEDGGTGQLGGQGARTAVWVPVTDSESARGALVLARCRPAPFTHAEAGLLVAMAYRIGLALEQAQHSRQLERAVAAGLELRGHLDEAEVQREVARLLPGVVAGDAGVLVSLEGDGGARWVAQHGLENAYACEWERLTNHLLANGLVTPSHSFTAPDLREVTDWPPGERGCPIRALLAAPIRWQGTLCGMLYALRFTTRPFTPDAAQVAMLYAAQASAALENARLYRAIRGELSERARAEQEVRQSEERLKLALEGGALGMWDWHVGTNRVRVDQRWSQIVGRHPHREEVDLQEYLARVHPDERRLVTDGLLAHIRGMTPQYEIEHRLLRDGEPDLWLLARGRVTQWDDAGQPVRVVGTIMDVTVA
ncbi:MAG TPA: GAF domain-containing protein, partial [Longimicrobiales bacterium]